MKYDEIAKNDCSVFHTPFHFNSNWIRKVYRKKELKFVFNLKMCLAFFVVLFCFIKPLKYRERERKQDEE